MHGQWLAARSRAVTDASATPKTGRSGKRERRGALTASEKKDLQTMEETILEAEAHVEACQQAFDQLEQASDHVEAQQRWDDLEEARRQVNALYARWEELENKANESA